MAIAGRQDDGSARIAWMPAAAASVGLCVPSDASPTSSGVTNVGTVTAMAQLLRSKKGAPRSTFGNKDETLFQDESEGAPQGYSLRTSSQCHQTIQCCARISSVHGRHASNSSLPFSATPTIAVDSESSSGLKVPSG
jgi:hypothetical protein